MVSFDRVDADEGLIFCVWRGITDLEDAKAADILAAYVAHDTPGAPQSADVASDFLAPAGFRVVWPGSNKKPT